MDEDQRQTAVNILQFIIPFCEFIGNYLSTELSICIVFVYL